MFYRPIRIFIKITRMNEANIRISDCMVRTLNQKIRISALIMRITKFIMRMF